MSVTQLKRKWIRRCPRCKRPRARLKRDKITKVHTLACGHFVGRGFAAKEAAQRYSAAVRASEGAR